MSYYYPAQRVLPRVWIGSAADATSLDFMNDHTIGLVVNCTKDVPSPYSDFIETIRIPLDDHETSASVLYDYARPVARRMRLFLETHPNESILVHCAAGISRSSSMVAAFLILEHGYTMEGAIRKIQQRKPETFSPRVVFASALRRLESELIYMHANNLPLHF